ncbi:hypothetical protein ACPYIV_14950 [Parabacteroides sp. ASD2025]
MTEKKLSDDPANKTAIATLVSRSYPQPFRKMNTYGRIWDGLI